MTPWAAKCAACWLEPHWRSMVVAGTSSGQPAASTALRPMFTDWAPACMTQPMITSSTSHGVEVVALLERPQRLGGKIGGVPSGQLAVPLAAGGTDGIDDDSSAHVGRLLGAGRRGLGPL